MLIERIFWEMDTYKAFRKSIAHDLHAGLLQNWKRYAALAAAASFACAFFYHWCGVVSASRPIGAVPSFGDYLCFLMSGMKPYAYGDSSFEINALWLLLFAGLGYIVCDYPLRDIKGFGQQILLRSQSRMVWWGSKCVWCFLSVCVFYAVLAIICFLAALFTGSLSILPNAELQEAVLELPIRELSAGEFLAAAVAVPFLVSVSLTWLQTAVSLTAAPLAGFIGIVALLAYSVYYPSSFLPGNFLMLLRFETVSSCTDGTGWTISEACLFSALTAAVALLLGSWAAKRKDILS